MRFTSVLTLAAVGLFCVLGAQVRAQYEDEVLADEPFAYWRLGDEEPTFAFNASEIDPDPSLLDGTYVGGALVEEDGLLSDDPDTAVRFDGVGSEVQIPDSPYTNAGGPYQARTTELWFNAEVIEEGARAMLFEGGGTTRGLGIWVEEVDGQDTLFMSMWNRAQEFWDPVFVSTEIEEGVTYHAVMVFDASENDAFGDFDGRITGYLDGEEFDTAIGADQLYNHGDNYAIGSVQQNTYYPDGSNPTNGDYFNGVIDEVACYSYALDDPDDDGDFSDSRVMDHFVAGSGTVAECPGGLEAARDGGNIKLTWEHRGAATSVRVTRDGMELAAAAPVDPPEYVDTTAAPGDLRYELTFNTAECPARSRQFDGCISDLEASVTAEGIELAWVNNFAYTNIVIQRGDDVIATIGGDQQGYVDTDPSLDTRTYSVFPENGDCEPAVATASTGEVLGTGTEALLGSDLTDIDDDGDELLYNAPDDFAGFDAEFFSSDEPGFGGGEFAFNVFDNILGPSNDKWCCGTTAPQIVGADFTEFDVSYRLTHFTVSSANDVPDRDPRVWRVEGSNDGEEWTTIFSQDNPDAALWTQRFEVILFEEGVHYEVQTEAYSMFRMVTEETGLASGNYFQIGEIELFGEEGGLVAPGASVRPGDVNADSGFNIADMVAQLNFLFGGASLPDCYVVPDSNPVALNATGLAVLDYNGDGGSNIADAVAGLGGLFGGGAPHVLGEDCVELEGTCEDRCQ